MHGSHDSPSDPGGGSDVKRFSLGLAGTSIQNRAVNELALSTGISIFMHS